PATTPRAGFAHEDRQCSRGSSSEQILDRGIRIDRAIGDARDRRVKTRFTDATLELSEQRLLQERLDLAPRGRAPALHVVAGLARPRAVLVDRVDELR